jgi:hypothetical protein
MKIVRAIIIVFVVLIGLFFLVALFLPSTYTVKRSIEMECTSTDAYNLVSDFTTWMRWNPFTPLDTTAWAEVSGPIGAVGSTWMWHGDLIGIGSLTITELDSPTTIRSKMVFEKPRESEATDTWTFEPVSEGTEVTWSNSGHLSYPMGRWAGLFVDRSLIGPTFERGLENLKEVCEEEELVPDENPMQ